MKKLRISVLMMIFLFIYLLAFASESEKTKQKNPFACLGEAIALRNELSTEEIKIEISKRINTLKPQDSHSLCVIAELMKRVGDYRAEDYYKNAIYENKIEPAYELFYADYLRNFRGPQRPLFSEAEDHYFKGLRKLEQYRKKQLKDCEIKSTNAQPFDCETQRRIERGIITLYQEDGFPLLYWKSNIIDSQRFLKRPYCFFSTINNYGKLANDLDQVDDIRDLTSESLFASSEKRLNRKLNEHELKNIIRIKEQFETFNRIRFRYKNLPVIDILYRYKEINNAQITSFLDPNNFNDVKLNENGIVIDKPFNFSPVLDFFLKGSYKRTKREGIIEFLPETKEEVNHYETNAVVSRFFGPDKSNLEITYLFQDINPDIPNPPKREREIFAARFSHQIFRPLRILQSVYEQRFATRGLEIFGGIVQDKEKYGDTDVRKKDFFIGTSFKGLGDFDLTIQPTIFTSEVEGDKSQDNSQYRTNFTLLYRILDEEKEPGIPKKIMGVHPAFLHLVIAIKHDIAIEGLESFENAKVGIGLDAKLFNSGFRKTTFLVSARYDYQRFYNLNKDFSLFIFNLSMGF